MKLLAQDGFNCGQKIHTGIENGWLDGFVISAKFHAKEKVAEFITQNRIHDELVLFDPEFYAFTLPEASSLRDLKKHSYAPDSVLTKADFGPKGSVDFAKSVIEAQQSYGLEKFISPSVIVEGFENYSGAQAFNLFLASIDACDNAQEKLILSLPVTHNSLSKRDEIETFLNELTKLDVYGFYIIVDRSSTVGTVWNNPEELAGLLLLVNVLSEAGYYIHIGYTDMSGLLALAVGADSISTGWFSNTRRFDSNRYYTSSGGSTPKQRYFSSKLLNFLYIEDELAPSVALGLSDLIVGSDQVDTDLIANIEDPTWNQNDQTYNYWRGLKAVLTELDASDDALSLIKSKISDSLSAYANLKSKGVDFSIENGSRQIEQFSNALSIYEGWKSGII